MTRTYAAVLVAAPFFFASAVQADISTQLIGQVATSCEVSGLTPSVNFTDLNAGTTATTAFNVACNDADGFTISLTSTEGGLESDDAEGLPDELFPFGGPAGTSNDGPELDYIATLSIAGVAGTLVLDTIGDILSNDVSVEGSVGVALGAAGTVDIALQETATIAGGWSDTLQIGITAN